MGEIRQAMKLTIMADSGELELSQHPSPRLAGFSIAKHTKAWQGQ